MLTLSQILARKNKVTGGTVAPYLALSPYDSPLAMWLKERSDIPWEGNLHTVIGEEIEYGLARSIARKILHSDPDKIVKPNTRMHPEYPWWVVHADFLFWDLGEFIQIKNHSPHMTRTYLGLPGSAGNWDNNLVPPLYLIQCQWEMEAFEQPFWLLGAYFGGDNLRVYRIKRDRRMLVLLTKQASEFWKLHLDPSGPQSPPTNNKTWKPDRPDSKRKGPKLSPEEIMTASVPVFAKNEERAVDHD
ncbi:hypothetical protein LCGC14_0960400 [marine sediment metagenome]|uniref:YqaJ viral recombinase domain-containing protein n=1 Tax=marine sediment metagenome TaxID=412755 RepID=A0A0F9QXW6_9ZZZZ